jgi:hypothetical protein
MIKAVLAAKAALSPTIGTSVLLKIPPYSLNSTCQPSTDTMSKPSCGNLRCLRHGKVHFAVLGDEQADFCLLTSRGEDRHFLLELFGAQENNERLLFRRGDAVHIKHDLTTASVYLKKLLMK